MATEPEEGNRPGLHWPEHDLVPASRREDPAEPEEPKAPAAPAIEVPDEPLTASVLFTVASRLESLKTSLATMGSRVESLARSEEQFREFTTARLGEHTQQIADSMQQISTTLDTHGREQEKTFADRDKAQEKALADRDNAQEKALAKLQQGVDEGSRSAAEATEALDQVRQRMEEFGQSVEVLTGQVQAVAEDVPSLRAELIDFISRSDSRNEELATELTHLVDEVKVLRRRLPVRAASATPAKRAARRVEPEPAEDEDDFLVEEAAPVPRRRSSRARRSD